MALLSLLYPTIVKNRITDITPGDLERMGVTGLLLDVDNTLTDPKSQHLAPEVKLWLESMSNAGIRLTIVSNALPRRVNPFARKLGLRCISFACKPSPIGFLRGARRLRLKRRQCAAVGDQTFTDIAGARLAGVKSIQVMPMTREPQWTIRLKRRLERFVLGRYHRHIEKKNRRGGM